jgi:two-component system, OmpR family, alkaline phosphatase synthesis response regulator PhoP
MPVKILLVEDEEHLLNTIKLNLELEGYDVLPASDGNKAIEVFRKGKPDLVVLDVMLPGMSGLDVCRIIRQENDQVPVLFLTAKGTSYDKVYGLKLGADDYLTKPFDLEEFLLRVQILLKRRARISDPGAVPVVYKFGNSEINFLTYEIIDVKGEKRELSKREVQLLRLLIERKNEVVSRDTILEEIWGVDSYSTSRTIDNYILAFRKYFEHNPKEPRYFHSVRGVGYKFTD